MTTPPSKWQPIETAPKDGTRILAWEDRGPVVVHWADCSSAAEMTERMGWASTYDCDFMEYNEHSPKHWIPIPDAPR